MNYAEFYSSAKKMLIDSMVSIWFRGRAKEQEYMRFLLSEEEPLLSEPVFQSIFPWEESKNTFEEHASKLNILTPEFVKALGGDNVDVEYRFPLDRHPYKHQTKSWQNMLSGENKTLVVTSGTGSGKTECFMIPVLQDIVNHNERDCVQAIFLYPLNALMKSQQKRIHAWCNALPQKITYAIYNGDTEKSPKSINYTSQFFPELITRPQIRQTPPQVLFTNPTMLNYMLVRSEDQIILEKSQGKLRWILLDEAHTYTGSSAAELALQLRRVLDAFGVTIDQVNFAVTSATIGDEKDPNTEIKLRKFVSQITGKPFDSIVVIGGKRIVPEMNESIADSAISQINEKYSLRLSLNDIERLRKKLNTSPVLFTKEIAKILDNSLYKDLYKSLEVIDALGQKIDGLNKKDATAGALLPSRIHYFIRSINGVYACVNNNCKRHKKNRLGIGNLTTIQNTNCPDCKSRMLELATCPSCGGTILVGESSTVKGYRMHANIIDLENGPFYEGNEDLIESEELLLENNQSNEVDGFTPFYYAKPELKCLRRHTFEGEFKFNFDNNKIELASDETDNAVIYKSLTHSESNACLCPHCGNNINQNNLNFLRASATQMGRVLSTLLLDHAESSNKNDADILYDGKKYIAFTDNRQGSARSAMGINQDVERTWIRGSIFHKLADLRLDGVESGELTSEEEQTYTFLKNADINSLPSFLKNELSRLEAKKKGMMSIPTPKEVSFDEICHSLENNADFRKLFKHISAARGESKYANSNIYLKALLIDQFGWIPKRANSLENMGLVRLVYPDLKKAKCPTLLLGRGFNDLDWQNYLKICVDYLVRGGRHYMVSGEYKDYLTQNDYVSPIYPRDSELRRNGNLVQRWPSLQQVVKGVREEQSRVVLLLCAALGYNDVDQFDDEKIANINSLLNESWTFISSNILDCTDKDNKGYMLDLLGPKVKLQLIETAYLCPVDNVIVDVSFAGYSPRMNGYIGQNNFERYRIKRELKYPYFPFKSGNINDEDLSNWINQNLSSHKKEGIVSNMQERIYSQKPIFISAEHSAQQSREDLDRYEKEFNSGHLNILSCSTTMEMGVDIGGISEVVMNNVPPKSANYLQRAGRAGRRNESKALALTFCAPNPIGSYTWNHPEYPITHITETPLVRLESRQLIQRHVNALVFSDFVASKGGMRITSQLSEFFEAKDEPSLFDAFLTHIEGLISNKPENIDTRYRNLVRDTSLLSVSFSDTMYRTKRDILGVYNLYKSHIDALDTSIESIKNTNYNASALKSLEHQKTNFLKTSFLTYLAEKSFLPSAGIPTGLVECELSSEFQTFSNLVANNPTMHLSQAISSYAPGTQVVKNEWIYVPAGIRLKTKYDSTSRYILQNCNCCGYTTINYGNAMNNCIKCGSIDSMHGIKDMSASADQRFTEVVEPAAFTVEWAYKPTRKMKGIGSMDFIQPILLEMNPWAKKISSAKIITRCSTSKSEILFYNRGKNGFGYGFCPYCGKMESEPSITLKERFMSGHKHLRTGQICQGGESGGANIRRHVLLVGRYQTDFVEIKFYNGDNTILKDSETLYSLGVIISRKLTELLGVNDGEIDFGYDNGNHSIFIYDTALGGAGYSPLFRDYKDIVLEKAYQTLNSCNCERSCTKCLIDRRSQWYLNYLNRKKVLEWLEMERRSRIAPESISSIFPQANAVTTDFSTELYNLSRNRDVEDLKVFVDDNYKNWQPNEFPYSKMMTEMGLGGVGISFVINKYFNLSSCSMIEKSIIMSAINQYNFVVSESYKYENLRPLLLVNYFNGKKVLYFGENIKYSLNNDWGNGDVYFSFIENDIDSKPVDLISLLEKNNDTNNVMFETRIKNDSTVSALFDSLVSSNIDKWNRIKQSFVNKEVEIRYTDRYLHTPLACLLLGNFIMTMSQFFNCHVKSVNVSLIKPNQNDLLCDEIKLTEDYKSNSARNSFLTDCINNMVDTTPVITDNAFIEHERCLSVIADDAELCIRPDAGIAYGWKLYGHENDECTDEDVRNNWSLNLRLYNQYKNHKGILYTISYNKH